ncbi:fumarylacetoacetate hydrolase family protein [Candidatus Pelagibacter communis]|uniref:fumarylacetoacetate hydrolase family protein n=1 Tax=Pelagibacter ubique TaxID=198252 RepID=UPI00094C0994|nr:fumarylacetoacetate hydrolase family protein [Candidatus Pelagibacter ubique]
MKLCRIGNIGNEKPALIDNENNYRDLSSVIDDLNPETLNFDTIEKIKNTEISALPKLDPNLRIGPCVSNPSKFIGIGLNFKDHAEEQNLPIPTEPIIFSKFTSCITGPNDPIEVPKGSNHTDWEVELGFVIGKKGKNISINNALEHVLGFFLVNDVSERDFQKNRGLTWDKGKGFDTFGPIGPYILTKDELPDFQKLNMFLDVDGKRMQTGNTEKMIFDVKTLVSYMSSCMTLLPGDICCTGTPPGVGENMSPPHFLKGGEEVVLGVDKLGQQKHKVIPFKG